MRYTRREVKRRIKRANAICDRLEATRLDLVKGKNRKNRQRWKREMVRLVWPLMRRGLW